MAYYYPPIYDSINPEAGTISLVAFASFGENDGKDRSNRRRLRKLRDRNESFQGNGRQIFLDDEALEVFNEKVNKQEYVGAMSDGIICKPKKKGRQ